MDTKSRIIDKISNIIGGVRELIKLMSNRLVWKKQPSFFYLTFMALTHFYILQDFTPHVIDISTLLIRPINTDTELTLVSNIKLRTIFV